MTEQVCVEAIEEARIDVARHTEKRDKALLKVLAKNDFKSQRSLAYHEAQLANAKDHLEWCEQDFVRFKKWRRSEGVAV